MGLTSIKNIIQNFSPKMKGLIIEGKKMFFGIQFLKLEYHFSQEEIDT